MVFLLVKDKNKCKEMIAKDKTRLREILHPKNDGVDLDFSVAFAKVSPGEKTEPHILKSAEVYYILKGKGLMYIDNKKKEVYSDFAVYIPPNSVQYIKNTGEKELDFLCIVSPPWKPEDDNPA